jgi:hypothetical protein
LAVTFDASGKIEFEQGDGDLTGRQPRLAHQYVDGDGRYAKRFQHPHSVMRQEIGYR